MARFSLTSTTRTERLLYLQRNLSALVTGPRRADNVPLGARLLLTTSLRPSSPGPANLTADVAASFGRDRFPGRRVR